MSASMLPVPISNGPPGHAELLSPYLLFTLDEARYVTFYDASGPIHFVDRNDPLGIRIASALLVGELELATAPALAEALGCARQTVRNAVERYFRSGMKGLLAIEKGGRHKGPRSMAKHMKIIQKLLNEGMTVGAISRELGIADSSIRHHMQLGTLIRPQDCLGAEAPPTESREDIKRPTDRVLEDQHSSEAGVAVKRCSERGLASLGLLSEATPRFEAAEAVCGAGALLGIPMLVEEGLFETFEEVYGSLKPGYYGLRTIVMTMVLMAFLRIKTPEQLERWAPGELGRLLGMDRTPEVKTFRRKLQELATSKLSGELVAGLGVRYARAAPEALSVLYIDGHVQVYDGRKLEILKTYVARRKRNQRGEKEYWVNDNVGRPLFFVLSPTNEGILKVMDEDLLPEIRKLVGEKRHPLLVFDREGWSPDSFEAWYKRGFDILTYRKGTYDDWARSDFQEVIRELNGKPVKMKLAVKLHTLREALESDPEDHGFLVNEIRFLDGETQVSLITTCDQGGDAYWYIRQLRSRWRQENFFRYMRQEYNFDHAVSRATEPADPAKLVVNPARKEKAGQLQAARRELASFEQEVGARSMEGLQGSPARKRKRPKDPDDELRGKAAALRERVASLEKGTASLPPQVRRDEILPLSKILVRDGEHKRIVNAVKMAAYRSETWLFRILECLTASWTERDRAFLQTAFQLPGDLLPDYAASTLTMRLHPPPTWRWKRGLQRLCEVMTRKECRYPGTQLRLIYEVVTAN